LSVVSGDLVERRVTRGGLISRRRLRSGRSTWVAPAVVHDVGNVKRNPAVSVHAYSPPLSRMSFYDRDGWSTPRQRTVDITTPTALDALI
jgi:hypothetical protein